MSKRALMMGITGWDDASLTELLPGKGYGVHGLLRRARHFDHESPRRGETFVTCEVPHAEGRIKQGLREKPDPYVIATGSPHRVRELVGAAFVEAGLDRNRYVALDPRYLRPTEADDVQGDATTPRACLGWRSRMDFQELARIIVAQDSILRGKSGRSNLWATEPPPAAGAPRARSEQDWNLGRIGQFRRRP